MGKPKLKLNSHGLNQVLNSVVAPQLEQKARAVAAGVPGYATGVQMSRSRTGRPVALVAITEPHGILLQARHGLLTRAAADQGLDIHRYPISGGES